MFNKSTKIVSLLMAFAMVLAIGAGCAPAAPAAPAASPAAPTATAPEAAPSAAPEATPAEPAVSDAPLKIAMLLPGVINDGGWNTMAYTALEAAKEKFGAEIAYTENVTQNDQVKLLRQYATKGYGVVIGHGFEFGDSITEVAAEFPDVTFMNFGGTVQNGTNLASIQYAYGEGGALMGALIGTDPKYDKVGVILPFEDPTSMTEFINMEKVAKELNPKVEFNYTYTGDWNDIAKSKEAAIAAINNGAKVIATNLSGPIDAVLQAVVEKNVQLVAVTVEAHDKAPDNVLSSVVQDATMATLACLQRVVDGTFEGTVYAFGLADEVVHAGEYGSAVTDEMKANLEKYKADILSGKFVIDSLVK